MRPLLILLTLAAGLCSCVTNGGLSEDSIARFYDVQVDAFLHQDQKTLCAQYAPEYRGFERQIGEVAERVMPSDKASECKNLEQLFAMKKRVDEARTNGDVLGVEFTLERTGVEIAPDRKSADVHLKAHLNFGGVLIADSIVVEHLVDRGGQVLSVASETEAHVSGIVAYGTAAARARASAVAR
jgi:hypothetical protein